MLFRSGAQDLSVVACDAILDVADGTSIDPGFVETTFASSGLDYLREQVLRIGRWEELPEHLRMLGAEKTANP